MRLSVLVARGRMPVSHCLHRCSCPCCAIVKLKAHPCGCALPPAWFPRQGMTYFQHRLCMRLHAVADMDGAAEVLMFMHVMASLRAVCRLTCAAHSGGRPLEMGPRARVTFTCIVAWRRGR